VLTGLVGVLVLGCSDDPASQSPAGDGTNNGAGAAAGSLPDRGAGAQSDATGGSPSAANPSQQNTPGANNPTGGMPGNPIQGSGGTPSTAPPPGSGGTTQPAPQESGTDATAPAGSQGGATPGRGGSVGDGGGAGLTGTGGSGAGASPAEGSGGAGQAPPVTGMLGCSGSEFLCDDFENVDEGSVPGGSWDPLDESCQFQVEQFNMGVSQERANSGSRSLKITNKHFAQCRLSGSFGQHDEFWVRAYMYWEPDLDTSNRETLAMDLTPGRIAADDPAVRFGYRSKAPCEEYAGPQITIIGLAGGEATGCGARELPRGEWYCFEAHVTQTDSLVAKTYINGEAISYQSTGKEQTDSVATESAITQQVDHLRLGLFSTGEAQGVVYVDDVAVAAERLGCSP
jgi:hypothetical protein